MSSPELVTVLIDKLKAGDPPAAQQLSVGYFPRLVGLARKNLTPWAGGGSEAGFDVIPGEDPTPEVAALLAEEFRCLLDRLNDPEDPHLRDIAVWRMEGYSNADIARKLGCSPPTVERRLRLIRTLLADT
jgi:hypothetical protein